MAEYKYGINQESREQYRDRIIRAGQALARSLGESDVVTPRHFEDIENEFGVDNVDLAAELGAMQMAGVLRRQGLGYQLDEQALAAYRPAQGW